MQEPKINIYNLTDEREKSLWQNAIFIFDSSALLDFYFLPLSTRQKVFDELFSVKLKGRLWIPAHVKFEYTKNRENIIRKPITENYKPLKDENLKSIKSSLKEIENKIVDLKNKTKKDDKHPYLPQEEIDIYIKTIEVFKNESQTFEDSIVKHIGKVEEEIKKIPENDDVLKAIVNLFKVGRYYSFQEIIEITKEGKHRFDYSIPPGYEDLKDNTKKGTQIFGDLIIWKQILEFANESKQPIIFICNDLKEDWCYLEKSTTEKRIEKPREELIKEIYDFAGVEFWMYNQPQFLYKSNQYYEAKIEKQNIDNLSLFITSKTKASEELVFVCDLCGKVHNYEKDYLCMELEYAGTAKRPMGQENEYRTTYNFNCECGEVVRVTFHLWEYPEGRHFYDEVSIVGARLISCFDFSMNFHNEPKHDKCGKCGKQFIDRHNIGICDACEKEYNK